MAKKKGSNSTEKKLLATIQKQSQEISLLKNVLSLTPGNLFWKDRRGKILGCNRNAAQILKFTPDKLVDQNIYHLLRTKQNHSAKKIRKTDQIVLRTGREETYEEIGLDLQQRPAIYLTRKSPLRDHRQKISGIIGIALDITDRKKMEHALIEATERAKAASLAKSTFIANMNHDIKTPLSGMLILAETLVSRLTGDDKTLARTLLLASEQLYHFTDQCLQVASTEHFESNRLFDHPNQFNIRHMLQELQCLFQPTIQQKALTFLMDDTALATHEIVSYPWALYRILLNLIGNAVKFTAHGSIKITLATKRHLKNTMLIVTIQDTGIGIAKKNQRKIFEAFTRLVPTYQGKQTGSGIGLHVVKTLLQQMQGTITVQSRPKKGSVFTLTLPVTQPAPSHETPLPVPIQQDAGLSKKDARICTIHPKKHPLTVLLVEDSRIAQTAIMTLLADLKCQCTLTSSGEEALKKFKPGDYHVILLDIGLPGLQGDHVMQEIRAAESKTSYRATIIALTAHIANTTKKKLLASGFDHVFTKPTAHRHVKALICHHQTGL